MEVERCLGFFSSYLTNLGYFFSHSQITLKCSGMKPNELLGVIFVFCLCNLWVYLNVLVAVIF